MAVIDLRIDGDIDAALERASYLPDRPTAISAAYDARLDAIVLELKGGRRLLLPRAELQGLENATQAEIADIEVHFGVDICWPQLDLDHYLLSLIAGQYGPVKWMHALEMRGMNDSPNNSPSAFAKAKAYHDLYPLTAPFGSVERQCLQGVRQISHTDRTVAYSLQFESDTLLIAAHPSQSIEVTLQATTSAGNDVSLSPAWRAFIGRAYRRNWLAMDQYGRLDTVLLAFEDAVGPEVALSITNAELDVKRLLA